MQVYKRPFGDSQKSFSKDFFKLVQPLAAVMPLGAIASPAQAFLAKAGAEKSPKAELSVLLFPGFETIDAMGPVEMFGNLRDFSMHFVSLEGGVVKSAQALPVMTE